MFRHLVGVVIHGCLEGGIRLGDRHAFPGFPRESASTASRAMCWLGMPVSRMAARCWVSKAKIHLIDSEMRFSQSGISTRWTKAQRN